MTVRLTPLIHLPHMQARYFSTYKCPEMPPVEEAGGFCHDLIKEHKELAAQVLRTPPFVSCPASLPASSSAEGRRRR